MNPKLSKSATEEKINNFFEDIENKSPKEVRKVKRLAMAKKIALKEKRKLFCKKCLAPYSGKEKIRIKNRVKSVECLQCKDIARWKL